MTTTTLESFDTATSRNNPGYSAPQRMGRKLWAPMWAMALALFAAGFVVALVRSDALAGGGAETTVAALAHVVPGLTFLGFAAVFAAISFAIARILGEFRDGGGRVQETLGAEVQSLEMPVTGRIFIIGMMLSMVTLVVASIIHFVVASGVFDGSTSIAAAETAAIQLEAVRRIGVAGYLLSITLGLGTIQTVLRFQARRVSELGRS